MTPAAPPPTAFRGPLAHALGASPRGLVGPDAALPIAPASDRAVWDLVTGSADRTTASAVLDRAKKDLGSPWPQPLASAAARVFRDGDREGWETPAFARQRRLSGAAIAAALTLADEWIDEVADGIQLLCEQSSWCWPAHDDVFDRHGGVLADTADPYLDLGAGEIVAQLAWIDHLLGAQLDTRYPGMRARIRREAAVRIFTPFLTRRDWHWIGLDGDVHNWNPWIHGNVLLSALRLLNADDPHRTRIVELCIEGIDRYVAALPDDGAIDEGYAYWWNGACRALEALDVLAHASEGRLDPVPHVRALRETIAFPLRCQLGGEWYLNVADGQAKPPQEQPWHAVHRAALHVGDTAARAYAASHRMPGAPVAHEDTGLGRLLRGMTDPEWIGATPAAAPLPEVVWLPSTQVLLARPTAGSAAGLTLAVKGGHNDEHHNHNDVGSFLVASDGVPVIVDAGRPTYTKQTFGPGRYDIWTMQSSWHNVPEIGGQAQSAGPQYAASDVRVNTDAERAEFSLDIARAYPLAGLRSWHRTAALDRPTGTVTITDAWDLEPDTSASLHLLVAGEVNSDPRGIRIRPLEGATPVRVRWTGGAPHAIEVRELDDPMLTDVWGPRLTRIALDVSALRSVTVTIERDDTIGEES